MHYKLQPFFCLHQVDFTTCVGKNTEVVFPSQLIQ